MTMIPGANKNSNIFLPWLALAFVLGSCSAAETPDGPSVYGKRKDAGAKDASSTDGQPDGCTLVPEACDGIDNNCDGETDGPAANADCLFSHAGGVCRDGKCELGTCEELFGDCDGLPANGCETPLDMMSNCGKCGNNCLNMQRAGGAHCDKGSCTYLKCETGYGDCDGDKNNGCEQKLDNLAHCGGCGKACAGTSCAGGVCTNAANCPGGFADCDGSADNGCEASLSSVSHCNMCGAPCEFANASASCDNGTCAFAKCKAGYGNCDGEVSNGCETALNTTGNCGACGTQCQSAGFCTGGRCTAIRCLADAGKADCDPNVVGCETFLNSLTSCGTCDNKCEVDAGQSISCVSGVCQLSSCPEGTNDCNKDPADGCESVLKEMNNCGACGAICALANASSSCVSGTCALVSCNPLFGDCDNNPSNGCETPLNKPENCGKCANACSTAANSTGVCSAGACVCKAGWGDCDGLPANGCEHDTASDAQNCGKCGNVCGGAMSKCCGGRCSYSWSC